MPDELWREVRDIVQETGIKTIPKKNKCKKAKWLSEEALQIAVKRREVKSKGVKERYTHLNNAVTAKMKSKWLICPSICLSASCIQSAIHVCPSLIPPPLRLTSTWLIKSFLFQYTIIYYMSFPSGSDGKASTCNAGDLGSIPGLGRSPGEGNGNPLQYSCLENPMDGGAW